MIICELSTYSIHNSLFSYIQFPVQSKHCYKRIFFSLEFLILEFFLVHFSYTVLEVAKKFKCKNYIFIMIFVDFFRNKHFYPKTSK